MDSGFYQEKLSLSFLLHSSNQAKNELPDIQAMSEEASRFPVRRAHHPLLKPGLASHLLEEGPRGPRLTSEFQLFLLKCPLSQYDPRP